jgi:hypothetical protein
LVALAPKLGLVLIGDVVSRAQQCVLRRARQRVQLQRAKYFLL